MAKERHATVPSEPITATDLMCEVCHACGGRDQPCSSADIENCLQQHLQRHPGIKLVGVFLARKNAAGELALEHYKQGIELLQTPPAERGCG